MSNMKMPGLAGLAVCLVTGSVHAQEPASPAGGAVALPTVTVEGLVDGKGGPLQPIGPTMPEADIRHQVTQSVSVVDRQEIERVNAISTLDLLARVPGVSVNRAGGIAGTIFLRGLNSNDMRSPLFIDGNRLRGRNTLQYMMLGPEDIDRIEVIRGPASSMYGSDGLTGLVNIVTRRAKGNFDGPFRVTGGDASLTWNSNGNGLQAATGIEAAGSGFDLRASVSGRRSDDYETPAGTVPNSDYAAATGSIAVGFMPDAQQRFEAVFRMSSVTDGNAGPTLPDNVIESRRKTLQLRQGSLGYTGDYDGGLFSHAEASLYLHEYYTKIGVINTSSPLTRSETSSYVIGPQVFGGRALGIIPFGDAETSIGFDFMKEHRPGSETTNRVTRYDSTGAVTSVTIRDRYQTGPDQEQTNAGIFANTEWHALDTLTLTGAARFDWYLTDVGLEALTSPDLLPAFAAGQDQEETATTGSIGLSWRPLEVFEVVGSVGTSFRMPWTSEMYSQGFTGTSYTIPNPGLKPEKGVNVEAGFRFHLNEATIGVTVFNSEYEDFLMNVTTTYNGLPATQRQNVSEARIRGIEIDWRWQATPALNVYGNATALEGTNKTTDVPLPQIAPFGGIVGAQYVLPGNGIALSGEVNWGLGRSRIATGQEYETGDYAILNLTAEAQLDQIGLPEAGNTRLVLSANNVFDTAYRNAATASNMSYAESMVNPLMEPGRSFTVSLRTWF